MKYLQAVKYVENFPDLFLVKDELFTLKQAAKMKIPARYLREVEISQRKTHYFFGARFADKEAIK